LIGLLLLISNPGCTYASGFELGLDQSMSGGGGYNMDRFCTNPSEIEKSEYKKGVDAGRASGAQFRELGITKIPANEAERDQLIADGLQRKREREIAAMEEELKQLRSQVQNQQQTSEDLRKKIEQQESEIKRLKAIQESTKKTVEPKRQP